MRMVPVVTEVRVPVIVQGPESGELERHLKSGQLR